MSDTNSTEQSHQDFSKLGEFLGQKADILSKQELETIGDDAKVKLRPLVDTILWEKGSTETLIEAKNSMIHQLDINHSLQHEHTKEEVVAMLKDIETHIRASINRTVSHFKELTTTPELAENFFSIYPVLQRPQELFKQQEIVLSELSNRLKYTGSTKEQILHSIGDGVSALITHHDFFQNISYMREEIIKNIRFQTTSQMAQLSEEMKSA